MIQGPDWRPDFPLQSRPQSRVPAADRKVPGVLASSWAIHKLIQGKARGKPGESQGKARGKPGESQGKARGKPGESQGKARGKPGESQGKARGKPSWIAEGEGARNSLDRASFTTLNGCRAFPTGSCTRMENPGYKGKNSVFFCTSELADIESRRLWPQTS